MIRDWTPAETFCLIRDLKANRCLWDKFHPLFKNADKRSEVLNQMVAKFPNCDVEDVKVKIRSLRTVYMENYRKKERTGGALPKWQFYTSLEFLTNDQSLDASDPLDGVVAETKQEDTADDSLSNEPFTKIEIEDDSLSSSAVKRRRHGTDDECPEMSLKSNETDPEFSVTSIVLKEHRHSKFGAFVASTMESMQDPEIEKLCEIRVRMLLAEMCQEAAKRQLQQLHRNSSITIRQQDLF